MNDQGVPDPDDRASENREYYTELQASDSKFQNVFGSKYGKLVARTVLIGIPLIIIVFKLLEFL